MIMHSLHCQEGGADHDASDEQTSCAIQALEGMGKTGKDVAPPRGACTGTKMETYSSDEQTSRVIQSLAGMGKTGKDIAPPRMG